MKENEISNKKKKDFLIFNITNNFEAQCIANSRSK